MTQLLLRLSFCLQIYFANEIDRRYGSQGLHATSVHPGGIITDLGRHIDPELIKGTYTDSGVLYYVPTLHRQNVLHAESMIQQPGQAVWLS